MVLSGVLLHRYPNELQKVLARELLVFFVESPFGINSELRLKMDFHGDLI